MRTLAGGIGGLLAAMRSAHPRLLHTHGYKANILGRIAGNWLGTPVVATFHAGERGTFPVNLYQFADEWTSFAGGRLAVSEAIRASLPFRATLARNFMVAPERPSTAPLPPAIGFVGRLSHEKGPDHFCEMARQSGGRFSWHIWGDGPMRAELESAYGDVVRFHGLVTDLEPVWSSIGPLIIPSRAEGLPMAALEALSRGVPILASRVGELPSIIVPDATGWLMACGDLEAAHDHIATWQSLDAGQQLAMRERCWRVVRSAYSDERHLPVIVDVYRRAGLTVEADALQAA